MSDDVKDWLLDYEKSHQEEETEEEVKSMDCQASDTCHCTGPPEGFVMKVN